MLRLGWTEAQIAAVSEQTYILEVAARHTGGRKSPILWLWQYTFRSASERHEQELEAARCWMRDAPPAQKGTPGPGTGGPGTGRNTTTEEVHESSCVPPQFSALALARQRILSLPALDEPGAVYSQIEPIMRAALEGHPNHGEVEDFFALVAAQVPAAKVGQLRSMWNRLRREQSQRALRNRGVPPEVYVTSRDVLIDRRNDQIIPREGFLTGKAREFGGDKAEAAQAYLLGADAVCPHVQGVTYHPGKPHGIGEDSAGVSYYNQYRAGSVLPVPGDVSPWLALLRRLDLEGGEESE
jgi:hypothetical protein